MESLTDRGNNERLSSIEIERLKAERKARRREKKRLLEKQQRKEEVRKLNAKATTSLSNMNDRSHLRNEDREKIIIKKSMNGNNASSHGSDRPDKRVKKTKNKRAAAEVSPIPPKSIKHTRVPTTDLIPNTTNAFSNPISFPINDECTSLTVSPSGRHIIAGFTDGTLRLFDTTGRLWSKKQMFRDDDSSDSDSSETKKSRIENDLENLFDCDSSDSEDEDQPPNTSNQKDKYVMSKEFKHFGAVACQIQAKGVITSLLMHVDCSEDGSFAFGGVLRGSTELVAVHLSPLERFHDKFDSNSGKVCILDLIKVYRFSDAKLKGFGACTRLKDTIRPEYRLFTGKGIKNMHIWSFIPPQGNRTEPIWQCLYDTPTNGNTISYLSFRTDSNGLLQGISKSDDQKLRIWDLSYEQSEKVKNTQSVIKQLAERSKAENYPSEERPKRPPYIDVFATENALGVFGPYVFSGGDNMFNKMGIMHLDVEDVQSPFNHNELALPQTSDIETDIQLGSSGRRSGRQQRGDLKSIVNITGHSNAASDVVLDLSDGSMVHYNNSKSGKSHVRLLPFDLSGTDMIGRKICISHINKKQVTILTKSVFDSSSSRGTISMNYVSNGDRVRYGFTEPNYQPMSMSTTLEKNRIKNTNTATTITPKKSHLLLEDGEGGIEHSLSDGYVPTIGESPTATNSSTGNVISPSSDGVAVSPDQPAPKSLAFQNEEASKNGASIKKYLQNEKGKKRKNTDARKESKNKKVKSKKVKFTGVPDSKVVSVAKEAKKPTAKESKKSPKPTEENVASALCQIQSAPICSYDWLQDKLQRASDRDSHECDVDSFVTSNKESECLNKMKTPISLFYRKSGTFHSVSKSSTNVETSKRQFEERRKMIIHQRASHERLKNAFLINVQEIIKIKQPLRYAQDMLDNTITQYEDMLRDLIRNQQMEAATLAATHTMQNGNRKAPEVQVSFPFPGVFDTARQIALEQFTSNNNQDVN